MNTTSALNGVTDDDAPAVLFSRDQSFVPTINLFSVPTPHRPMSLQNRQMVRHEGEDNGHGKWSCNKDKEAGCIHVTMAQHLLQRLILGDPAARYSGPDLTPGVCSLRFDLATILVNLPPQIPGCVALFKRSSRSRICRSCHRSGHPCQKIGKFICAQ